MAAVCGCWRRGGPGFGGGSRLLVVCLASLVDTMVLRRTSAGSLPGVRQPCRSISPLSPSLPWQTELRGGDAPSVRFTPSETWLGNQPGRCSGSNLVSKDNNRKSGEGSVVSRPARRSWGWPRAARYGWARCGGGLHLAPGAYSIILQLLTRPERLI